MKRPEHLPDFENPPLNEVAVGIQFAQPKGYQPIRAGEVWHLFRHEFPIVEDHPPLQPTFETFGLPQGPNFNIDLMIGAAPSRFWFLSPSRDELIQFQPDRLLHNWRKVSAKSPPYPRFENMISRFEEEIVRFQAYCNTLSPQILNINQCEVTYVNHIRDGEVSPRASDWLRFLDFSPIIADDFAVTFRKVIRAGAGRPVGRLVCDAQSAVGSKGEPLLILAMTVRGAPDAPNIQSALDFLKAGRELVVEGFAEITTDSAHQKWERVQ